MTFGLIYLGVFVILIWAFLLSSNLGAGYRYKFWPVSAPVYSQVWFGREISVGEKYALHADICNLGSGFLATDYMSFIQSQALKAKTRD